MKQTTEEKKLRENFFPGKITRDGFLGNDDRHIHDIISQDMKTLEELNTDKERVADKLQELIEEGKKGLENEIDYKGYRVRLVWSRGMLPSPFGDRPLQYKITAFVNDLKTGKSLKFTQMNVFLIKKHGFFGGSGSSFRLNPEELVDFLRMD